MGAPATSRGYDDLELADRRKLCWSLIDKAAKVTPEEEGELSVLLLMGVGLSEARARADVRLRARQHRLSRRSVRFL